MEDSAVLPDRHSSQDVTESWESPLPSSTDLTQINLFLSGQPKAKEKDSQTDYGKQTAELPNPLSTENANSNGCLSSGRCNGIMGVQITFLDKYNPEQFEIIGIANSA